MRKIGLAFFLLNTMSLQASICPQLSGKWQGVWSFSRIGRNLGHLKITKNIKGDFTGIYKELFLEGVALLVRLRLI